MDTDILRERLARFNDRGTGYYRCPAPACHRRKATVRWHDPWFMRPDKHSEYALHHIPWFRCSACGEEGTAEYLLGWMEDEARRRELPPMREGEVTIKAARLAVESAQREWGWPEQ